MVFKDIPENMFFLFLAEATCATEYVACIDNLTCEHITLACDQTSNCLTSGTRTELCVCDDGSIKCSDPQSTCKVIAEACTHGDSCLSADHRYEMCPCLPGELRCLDGTCERKEDVFSAGSKCLAILGNGISMQS